MSYWYVFLKWGTYWWSSCFYHAICKNNRNCLILDASLGHATVLTVRKNLTVGYLLLTVISLWILLSETAILLMPFGYWFLRNGYSFLRKPYLKYLHFPCCIFAYKEKGPVLCPVCGHFLCWNAWEQPWLMSRWRNPCSGNLILVMPRFLQFISSSVCWVMHCYCHSMNNYQVFVCTPVHPGQSNHVRWIHYTAWLVGAQWSKLSVSTLDDY